MGSAGEGRERGEIRAKGVAEGTGDGAGGGGEAAGSSEGLYFKIHPRLSRWSYRRGDGFFRGSSRG